MNNFIYVFDKDAADELLNMQFSALKLDDENGVYVFANKDQMNFSTFDFEYALSDTLTF